LNSGLGPPYGYPVITCRWREPFASDAVEALHAEGFGHDPLEYDWWTQVKDHLRPFYFGSCGFTPTHAGLIAL
jgi:hypothetical protein